MAAPPPAPVVRYGDHPDQVANLHLPPGADGPAPVVVLLHGGFWRERWDRTLMTPLAIDLARRGIASWNVEYRRVGQEDGGWPGTLLDVAAALDALAERPEVDPDRVVTVGHSAGGHLALWAAGRHRLPEDAPGATPRIRPVAAVGQAAVCDLVGGARDRLGDGAVEAFVGGTPADVGDRYAGASPLALLPFGVPLLLVHGEADEVVPPDQSVGFAAAARAAGDEVEVVLGEGADHFDVVDPGHALWHAVVARLPALLDAPAPSSAGVEAERPRRS